MVSVKALGATALTLMIAIPILMGYGLASTEETYTAWEADSTTNVTELLYNYETNYYTDYINPANNKSILQEQVYAGAGVTEWHVVAPEYESVGSNYTSIPTYESTTESVTLSTIYTVTTSLDYDGQYQSVGSTTSDADVTVATRDYMTIAVTSDATALHWCLSLDDGDYYTTSTILVLRDSADSWLFLFDDEEVSSTSWMFTTDADGTVTTKGRAYTDLSPTSDDYSFTSGSYCSLKLTYDDSTVDYLAITSATSVSHASSGTTFVGTDQYANVDTISIANILGTSTLSVEYMAESGEYADPAYGWSLPTVSNAATYNWWYNSQLNDTVRMMVYFPSEGYVYLGPATDTSGSYLITLNYSDSELIVNGTSLGQYTYAMVVMDTEGATVYGISSWPTIGTWPTTYNYVEVDYTDIGEPFYYIKMQSSGTTALFRVDSATIVAGTYPSTYNMSFKPYLYYPDQSYNFTIKSVALYGTALNVVNRENGTTTGSEMTVTDGKITVNGTTMSVRGLTISTRENSDGTWNTYVGGELVWENLEYQPYIDIWGEWSLTASMSLLTETTSTQQVWSPGTFAFDKEDFAACGLIVAGVCLVGLGMNGARSGTKMGILLLICGGGALVYLTLI